MRESFFAVSCCIDNVACSRIHIAFSTKGQDCSKCHTLKKDEAATLLKKFDQNIKVLGVGIAR